VLTAEVTSPGSLSLENGVRCYPDRVHTIVEALDRAVRLFPDVVALETPEGDVTYAELAELVEGAAERLVEEGLAPGDRFAVALRNGLSTKLAPTQWAYMLAHSGAALALGHPEFMDGLRRAGAEAGLAPERIRDVGDHLTGRRRPWRGAAIEFPD
jgi:non-ribosomal peptide synthetase component F